MNNNNVRKSSSFVKPAIALACGLIAGGCAVDPHTGQPSFMETFNSNDPCSHNARNIGIVAGVVAGAIIGNQVGDNKTGTLVGAGLGGLVGGLVGADMDRRKCELSKLAKQYNLDMAVTDIKLESGNVDDGKAKPEAVLSGLSVSLKDSDSNGHFLSDSDELTPAAKEYFSRIASAYSYPQQKTKLPANASAGEKQAVEILKDKRILVIGHTDDTGNSRLNADLSERRARAVAKIFHEAGISVRQIFFQGAGETFPIADNRTPEGRATNRRVEIVDLNEKASFDNYLASRRPIVAYYRPVGKAATPVVGARTPAVPPSVAAKSRNWKTTNTATNAASSTAPASTQAQAPAGIPAPATQTAPKASASTLAVSNTANIDFGGEPAGNRPRPIDVGKLSKNKSFSIISSAHAAEDDPVASCIQDRPRTSNGVKSLSSGKEYATSDYLPGLYDTSWAGTVNGHLVAFTHVAVLRDGGSPARKPQLLVYRDYKGDNKAKPSHSESPEVNTYRGDKALLYRVFANGPVRCVDIVIPNSNAREAPDSTLYYERSRTIYSAAYVPRLAK